MRLDAAQLELYVQQGYLIVDAPWPAALTAALRDAVDLVATDVATVIEAGGLARCPFSTGLSSIFLRLSGFSGEFKL